MPSIKSIWNTLRHHKRGAIGIGATTVIVAGIIAAIIIQSAQHSTTPHVTYTNISRNFKTCLVSTSNTSDASAWTAVQKATTQTPINAQHITAPPGATPELIPYLNSAIALHCQLIITAGPTMTDALASVAPQHPTQHFLNLGTPTHQPNIHNTTTDQLTALVINAAHGHYPTNDLPSTTPTR